jgi:hypothetical protein
MEGGEKNDGGKGRRMKGEEMEGKKDGGRGRRIKGERECIVSS